MDKRRKKKLVGNKTGCMLCLGRSNYFRFNHPKEAKKIKDALPNCRISCAPLNFLQELEENPEYLQMISDAAANVKKRSSSGSDRGQGRGSSGSDRGCQGRGSSGSDRGQGRGSSGSDKGYSKSLRSPNMVFNESQEDEEFLNKVSKFELLSRSRTSPTARSPTNKSFSPDGSYKGSYGAGAVSSDYRPHHTPEQSSSPSAYQYAGEKLFTKETATMRVSADFLKKTGKINEERTPSTASTSSSSLTSVSSTGGATLSWHSDSPDVVKSSKGHANSDMSSSHSGGIYTSTPKSTETRKEFVTLKSPTTPYKAPIVKVDSVNTKLAMTLDAEKLAESIMNGDLLTPYVGDDNDDKSSHRNTFEGMDFDFNELTASQQDLTLRHREIVAERKKEQEMEKLEKQRLEEILSMCAEYEEQITNPSTGQKVKVGDAGKQEHKPPWSMAQFLENNVPRNKTTPPMASVVQGEQLLRGNNALDSVPTFSSSDVSDSSYSVSASYLPLRNGASDSKDTHKNENGYNSGNSEIHSMAPGYHIYENSREIKEEQIPQREVRNYKEVFYHRNGIDNLQALQDQWRPNVLYSQEGQITSSTNQSSPKHKISPNSSFEKQNSPRGNSTPEKSPKEKKSPKFGVQVMFGNEFPKLSPSQHKVSEDLHSKKDNSHYLHSNIKEDNSKMPVKKDNSHCYAEVDIDKEIESVHGSTVPDKPTVNLSLKLQNDADAVQTSTSHTQRPLQLPSFQDFSSEVNSLDRKEKSERRSSGNTMSKIKTNGSLTMISSPSNPHKDFTMGFQMRRASSNSSNSEEESTSNSEDTGTIKRRPLMEMTKRRGSSSSNEGNSGKDNRMHSPEELSSCPKFSPAMGSRSPKLTRRKVYKEEVSKLSADSDGGSVSDKCINDSEKSKQGEFASRITDGCDVSVRLNGNDSALVPADYCSPEITVSNSSHNSDAGDTSWSSINSSQSGIYENIPARAAKPFKVEVKQGLKLPALVHTDISTSSLESSGKPSRSSSGSSCSKRSDDADNTTPMNSDGEITLARKRQTDRKSTGSDRSYKLREDSDSHQQLDRLKKSKQELQNRIVSLKHQITEIETQENEAIRELEMERALLEGEHQTELVELQRDKDNITALKSQQKILVDRYTQDREMEKFLELQQIDIEQQKLAELEERHLETEQLLETCSKAEEVAFLEQYHRQLEMIDGQRKILDDLEFKQLESEAKYEEEKEQLQRQLMVEQQELLTKYKSREDRLHQIDSQQDQMISGLKQDMHSLEHRRQNLVEEFRKEKAELSQIIKQIQETSKQLSISISEDLHKELSVDDLQEEKQKEELSRLPNSSEQDVLPATPKTPASIKNWVMTPDSKVTSTDLCVPEKGERKKSLTMLEIEKNHSLFLEQQGGQVIEQERRRIEELKRRAADEGRAQWEERKLREANCKSFNSLESEDSSIASSCETPSEKEHSLSSGDDQLEKLMELERLLAQAQQEKMKIIEDQVKFREKEMIELQEERQKREELERKLREETQLREELVQQQIKMRDRQTKQARPLTRYLPVRGKEFNLKQHIETAGHHLDDCHHVIVTPTSCRGWLNKMGNKFKTWHRRWFVFDRVKRSFIYYSEKNESKARGGIYFQAIEEVYVDHLRTVKSPNTKLTFCVKTADRTYYMVAPTAEAMRIWIDVIITGAEGYQEFL